MRLSSSKARAPLAALGVLLSACSAPPPPMPTDTTSVNRSRDVAIEDFTPEARAMNCDDIAAERKKTADAIKEATHTIDSNREHNVIMLAVATWAFTPMLLATENNNSEKDQIVKLYEHQDMLIKLGALKHCTAPSS